MTLPDLGFTLNRTYPATPERVYAHFTEPELLAAWFCPNPDLPVTCELDVQAGGEWRVEMGEWVVGGSYVEVRPFTLLVFTFDWEHDEDDPTTVTVEIIPEGELTRLVLAHEESGTDSGHEEGWLFALARLDGELSGAEH
jgi:uncharacterized protein YndB with AHSA1/START domain